MKIIIKIFIFSSILLPLSNLRADSDLCAYYRVKLILNNDSTIVGDYFYYGMYLDVNLDSLTFNDIIEQKKKYEYLNDTIYLYQNVYSLEYPKLFSKRFKACHAQNEIKIPIDKIKRFELIKKSTCYPEDSSDYKYLGCGFSPIVITELSMDEINILENKEPVFAFYFENFDCEDFCDLVVVSYNLDIQEQQIRKLLEEERLKNRKEKYVVLIECLSRYHNLREELLKQNIIIFRTYHYN